MGGTKNLGWDATWWNVQVQFAGAEREVTIKDRTKTLDTSSYNKSLNIINKLKCFEVVH